MQSQYTTIDLGKGVVLPYYEKGYRSGPVVIFLHGVTDSHRSFDRLAPYVPDTFHSYFVTQRGHGDASRPAGGYEAGEMAADIAGLMDGMNIGSAIIVGHSMGSFVSQRIAIDYLERVEALVLIGSFPTCKGNDGVEQFYDEAISQLEDPISSEFVREFQTSTFAKEVPSQFIDMVVDESRKVPATVWKQACGGMIRDDHTTELSRIKAPTLLIWGESDAYFSRSDQETLLGKITGSRLLEYPDVGHSPHWEIPERVAADITDFVTEVLRPAEKAGSSPIG